MIPPARQKSFRMLFGAMVAMALIVVLGANSAADEPAPSGLEFFEKKIRPLLARHCYECHSRQIEEPKSGLRLDSREDILQGGAHGAAIVPGKPDKSRLITAINYADKRLQMPPRGKLSDEAIADLTEWVRLGTPWPKEGQGSVVKKGFDIEARKLAHWAWRPVQTVTSPKVRDPSWARDPIDQFILARLEDKGLRPAEPTDRRTWIRRVTFDLIGLPPTAVEIDAFLEDTSAVAYNRVVDRLLASPHFGERWARHWLDLVRYAESRGHEFDPIIPDAFEYRDYVIRAFNADVPYNQFVIEHLAGDLVKEPRTEPVRGFNESILGTGFWFLGEEIHSPVDIRQDQADRFDNRIDVFGKTFLGLTVACARCHDHKFDAISQKDYYALLGFLSSSSYRLARYETLEHNRKVGEELAVLRGHQRADLGKVLATVARPTVAKLADYLLAVREALAAQPEFEKPKGSSSGTASAVRPADLSEGFRKRIAELAETHKIDPALLAEWVCATLNSAKDPKDPLYHWQLMGGDVKDEKRIRELLQPVIAQMRREREAVESLKDVRILADYGSTPASAAPWLPDDASFGPRPAQPGDVRLSGDPSHPFIRCITRGAADYDRRFDVLKVTAGAETDPGGLGKGSQRPGRTLCTPPFRIKSGKLHYLVRGAGSVYAAVSAHVEIDGPLHGQLILPIGPSADFRWVTQDLTRYVGLDAHVEFTATAGSDFAVAMVVEAAQAPSAMALPNKTLLKHLQDDASSVEKLAKGLAQVLSDTIANLESDGIAASNDPEGQAALADWLLHHTQLFVADAKKLDEAAGALLAKENEIASRIRAESRLAVAMLDGGPIDEHLFIRGIAADEGESVPRRFLEALAGPKPLVAKSGSGRLELAREITDPAHNPFVARVIVNRVWHHLFSRGIVGSVDNFGVLGEAPTHPELLDYLADRFVREGWSIKTLVRELALSSTYRMSTQSTEQADKLDPANDLLHKARLRRLEGEAIRDAMLSVGGRLDERMYGSSIPIYPTPFLDGRGRPGSGPLDGAGRRSVYLAVKRNFLSPMLLAFDTPSPFSTVGRRTVSNVPAQALILLNDPFVQQQAELWAKQVLAQKITSDKRVAEMYVAAFGRPPSDVELQACLNFLETQAQQQKLSKDDPKIWADLAHTLFNVKEFIYLN